jgi:hypothetical protein
MTGLRKSRTFWRQDLGDYDKAGFYRPPVFPETSFTALFSIQPLTGKETQLLPEGRRSNESYRIYGSVELRTSEPGQETCDQLEYRGKRFDVIAKMNWQNSVIKHYKYLVSEAQA